MMLSPVMRSPDASADDRGRLGFPVEAHVGGSGGQAGHKPRKQKHAGTCSGAELPLGDFASVCLSRHSSQRWVAAKPTAPSSSKYYY